MKDMLYRVGEWSQRNKLTELWIRPCLEWQSSDSRTHSLQTKRQQKLSDVKTIKINVKLAK